MEQTTLVRKKSRSLRELNTVVAVAAREITVFFKTPSMLVMTLAMPIMMMGMIGGNVLGMVPDFGISMLIGMIVAMLFMVTAMGMASLVDDHESDFNQEILVSPVSRYSLVVGKILGSTVGAMFSIVGTLAVGAVMGLTLTLGQLALILLLSPLVCFAGGAMSMILIGLIKNRKTANFAVMIITMPQMFLSGAIIPVSTSGDAIGGIMDGLSKVMPMTYCIDLARSVTDEVSSDPLMSFMAVMVIILVCLIVGTYFFAKTETNR